ncbi:phage tail protein [Paenibacillus sp. VCA1]|uniref:phage tail protein n=1 Tax=Paenibacillus sp. VCA1 TaxID=3039148 RepID=UPI0028720C5C|nr:phage tail protein [Paenibacillus sp. VCA1]MDR9852884.1 phage tail protein [Paenibacillus sp. VCA1]
MSYLQSYDKNLKRVGILVDAFDIQRTRRINADYSLTFSVPMTSADFREKLPLKGHVLDERGQYYVINSRQRVRDGRKLTAAISCSHVMFKLTDYKFPYASYISEGYGVHITQLTTLIQAATGGRFTISVDDTFDLVDVKDFGRGNCLQALNDVINMYGAEVEPDNFTIHLRKKIGNPSSPLRYQLAKNIVSASFTDDSASLCTRLFAQMKDGRTWIGQPASILTADERARLSAIPGAIVNGTLAVNYLVSQYAGTWASDSVPFYDDEFIDQNITDPVKLLEATRKALAEREVPTLEVAVDAADLYKLDKTEPKPGLGDTVLCVDNELGLTGISARITEMTEYPYARDKHTQVTVANVMTRDYAQIIADLDKAKRDFTDLMSGGRIRADVFEEYAKQAVIDVNNSKTEIKYDTRGIVLQDKTDARNQVIMTSNGIVLTTDGGATARTAITARGVVAETIVGQLGNFVSLLIGSGNNVTQINPNGIAAGHASFGSAPFRVDMQGNVVANRLTANSANIFSSNFTNGAIVGSSINVGNGQFTVDSAGNMYAGNGRFRGSIDASTFTGGVITGALLRTSESGARVEVDTRGWRTYDASNRQRISINANDSYGMSAINWAGTGGQGLGYVNGNDSLFTILSTVPMLISSTGGSVTFNGYVNFSSVYGISGLQMGHISGLESALNGKASRGDSTSLASGGAHNHGFPHGAQFKDINGTVHTWSAYNGFTHSHTI